MATSLDDLVNMTGVILAFEFTPDGTCTSYKNVTREMAAMICRFCAAVTMNFNALRHCTTQHGYYSKCYPLLEDTHSRLGSRE